MNLKNGVTVDVYVDSVDGEKINPDKFFDEFIAWLDTKGWFCGGSVTKGWDESLLNKRDAAPEMYEVLDKALCLLKTGKEEINDDTGDSELTLTSGDFWVSTMNDIERVLKKARGEE